MTDTPSPLERLMAETIPTRPRPAPRPEPPPRPLEPWTVDEQDAHWDQLRRAVGRPREMRPGERLLRLIDADGETGAA